MAKSNTSRLSPEPISTSPVPAGGRSPWILNRWADILLVVAAPIPVFLIIAGARAIWSAAAVSSFVMIWAIGHHLPGMMRAYGDPDLFRRFKIRFLVTPILLVAVCVWSLQQGFYGIHAIAGIWGWWHYLMQTYGFVRIYDAKVGSFAVTTRWLDWAMCLFWFAAAIVLNDNTTYGFLTRFYNSGLPIPSPEVMHRLRIFMVAATSVVTLLFVANLVNHWVNGRRTSPIKVALMVSTFAYFWYSAATVTNIVVAYAFFELFHDMQYLTIVWAFNRNRVQKDPHLKGFTRFLFRPRSFLIGTYIVMVCGYGLLDYGSKQISQATLQQFLFGCFLASTLLHYYFDGFIWKVREKETQRTLGISDVNTSPLQTFSIPGWLRHGLLWTLFVVPFVFMALSQQSFRANPLEDSKRLKASVPHSISAIYDHGLALQAMGKIDEAMEFYHEAQRRAPHHAPSRNRLVDIYNRRGQELMKAGKRDEALRDFNASLELDPDQIHIEVLVKRL